jgi:cell division protein FtsL
MPLVLLSLVVASGVATVYMKHRTRNQFIELQSLQHEHDEMQIQWGRLQLEESTWAAHDRVRGAASTQLGLYMPPGDAVVVVRTQ